MLVTLADILAARDEFNQPPCSLGVEMFNEHYPNGLEVRDDLYVLPNDLGLPLSYIRWFVEALKGELTVVVACSPPGVPTRDGYLMKAGMIGKFCDYKEYLKRYEEAK